jgi:hypothetical protein
MKTYQRLIKKENNSNRFAKLNSKKQKIAIE